ncbi:S53 family peptidase [Amycolatopsis mediterranei]|uniref:S53 family peptidase n=1 Tax=Amycolatopsis mediterranei TaxID=33910 RepID=UPI00341AB327
MSKNTSVALPGSERVALSDVEIVDPVAPEERITVTVLLRRRSSIPDQLIEGPDTLSRAALADRHGADPADVEAVRVAMSGAGLTVVGTDLPSRRVTVAGTAEALMRTFGAELQIVRDASGFQHRARSGELRLPAALDGIVIAVLGLDNRPQAEARFRASQPEAARSFRPDALGKVYGFPANTDGAGQTIAIVELGGGFRQSELDTYFDGLGIPAPRVVAVGVDGGQNLPSGDAGSADGEVLLDIEVAGALASGARQVVYFAPNTDRGFVDAVTTAVHADPTPAAVSISWGAPEDKWTAQARRAFDAALADAAALGVTVTAAAGDRGSADGEGGGGLHTDFPASSPHLLACGGTKLAVADGGTVASETVWNGGDRGGATGGGVSVAFGLPAYQRNAGVDKRRKTGKPGRGVPDVAAVADPATGYEVLVDGERLVFGGTSAVAPLWAALVARLTQALGRPLGLLNTALYDGVQPGRTQPGFRDVTEGDNDISGEHGPYPARAGWDACTGLGVPDGEALLAALRKLGKE